MVVMTIIKPGKKMLCVFIMLAGLLVSPIIPAIDNPDAPDLVAEFKARVKSAEKAVEDPNLSNRGVLIAYDDYQILLDTELNKAYQLLKSKLPKAQQVELKKSQKNWIKFRDTEFELIQNNWTRDNFGSSAGRSRGDYRSSIISDRVIQLLHYLQNY